MDFAIRFARGLRRKQTDVECALWCALRDRQIAGSKFRRQQPIGPYIVDFVCFDARLIVELDGGQHADHAAYDNERDEYLRKQGFEVLRFWNNQAVENFDAVLTVIYAKLQSSNATPHPNPLPQGERE